MLADRFDLYENRASLSFRGLICRRCKKQMLRSLCNQYTNHNLIDYNDMPLNGNHMNMSSKCIHFYK